MSDFSKFYVDTNRAEDEILLVCHDCDNSIIGIDGGDDLSMYVTAVTKHDCEGNPKPLPMWTVIGVWINDEPVVTGAVRGRHDVSGGNGGEFEQGLWATSVSAETVEEAERLAVREMLNDEDDE